MGVFNAVLGGDATFKQVFSVVAHAGVVSLAQQLFVYPLDYARGSLSSPTNLGVFLPFLDENTFPARLLGAIDLFLIWWMVNLAIGLGVLYKRRTGPIATGIPQRLSRDRPGHRRDQNRSLQEPRCPAGISSSRWASSSSAARWSPRTSGTRRKAGLTVTTEAIKTRDLEAIVSASGKIQPKRLVNISAETSGRVVDLAVNEGDRIKKGQFLLQIDPKSLRTRVDSGEASLQAAAAVARADAAGDRNGARAARVRRKTEPEAAAGPVEAASSRPARALEKAENDVRRPSRRRQSALQEREKTAKAQDSRIMQERATLESARYDLSKVRIESPIDGIVTRRNIQEGETAVIGTMNNAGTVLLELADMSVIQAEVEVDETNIPNVQLGQPAKITIDAIPDRIVQGPRHARSATARSRPPTRRGRHAGDELQGGRHARRAGARRAARVHLHRRHHDRDAQARRRRADSRRRRPRADLRRRTARS